MEDQSRMRVSDTDRHDVADRLRDAAAEGRLDWEELEERLEAAYAARTYAELLPITDDLPSSNAPVPRPASPPPAPTTPRVTGTRRAFAVWGGIERKGTWDVPDQLTVGVCMAGAELDLREARFPEGEAVITATAVMAGVEILVAPDTEVVIEGVGIMGAFTGPGRGRREVPQAPGPPARRLRVRGVAFWGGVSVERRALPGTPALPA